MWTKALARYLYANVAGLAVARFTAKDLAAGYLPKPEFQGVSRFPIGSGLIVDVGANRGQSIQAFRRFAPACRIVAFEPEPRSAAQLQLRYRRASTISIHGCALGSSTGSLAFFAPKYGHWDCDGMSATNYKEATEWLRDRSRMLYFDERKLSVQEHSVECRTLDSFDLAPCIVKLHAQGAEFDILEGSQTTIERHRPALMAAFPTPAVNELLGSWHYRPYDFQNGNFRDGMAGRSRTFTWYLLEEHFSQLLVG